MEINPLPPLTPEQQSALDAGQGVAKFVDPDTEQVYIVAPQPVEVTHSDEYIREKLDQARADIAAGRVSSRTTEELLASFRQRLSRES